MNTELIKYNLDQLKTPCYFYDMELLERTLGEVRKIKDRYGYHVHYALKANSNTRILRKIREYGFGADCVSGNEILRALQTGYPPEEIAFAGVGKADWEIDRGLEYDIGFFNCESISEIEVINERAAMKNTTANVALRINPEIDAKTHHYITTGIEENKFGINRKDLPKVVELLKKLNNIRLKGIHVHIGSQITDLDVFKSLCLRMNEIQDFFRKEHIELTDINVGGGLGLNYENPQDAAIPDFDSYFRVFREFLKIQPHQKLHFELGRSLVGQCGALVTSVLYIKEGVNTNFAVVDAGMTELIRPALYQAYHKITALTSNKPTRKYDVVGPICESSDYFGKSVELPELKRGDVLVIHSAGAYGEVMQFSYNLRDHLEFYYSADFVKAKKI
ncbi:MAG: diaminopimelate decarboxylase [Bacteroidales bacterium]|nr:diaminopimelate decarboxylase [Bacteroidales bacterium]